MKKKLIILLILFLGLCNICFAENTCNLREYSVVEVPSGTFIAVLSNQEISTLYFDIGQKVEFTATTDLYLHETNIIPKDTVFTGYVETINEPIVGTHASMRIKITKLKLPDGYEEHLIGYIYTNNGNLIGGGLTEPETYDRKASYRKGYKPMVGYAPGATRKKGEHVSIAAGADLLIVLEKPLYITHTVTN